MTTDNIAMFQKVSFEEYKKARVKMFIVNDEVSEAEMFEEWKNIKIPQRATIGSAGYDFAIPMEVTVFDGPDDAVLIPTGIRAKIAEGWVLMLFPRSGLGTKYGFGLDNTVGIIDSDYYENENNDGHLFVQCINIKDEPLVIKKGDVIAQVVFMKYLITDGDNAEGVRTGGFGSTDK